MFCHQVMKLPAGGVMISLSFLKGISRKTLQTKFPLSFHMSTSSFPHAITYQNKRFSRTNLWLPYVRASLNAPQHSNKLHRYQVNLTMVMQMFKKKSNGPLTLTLSSDEPVSLAAGAGVPACRVDADLGGVTVVRVCLTLVNVCNRERRRSYCFISFFL